MSDSDLFNLEGGVQAEEGVDAGHLSGFTPSVPSEVRLSLESSFYFYTLSSVKIVQISYGRLRSQTI